MKINVKRSDAIWSFIGTLISMSANFVILPFILAYLDDDSIGLYYVFVSLSAIASLFDFGFSPSFARSVAYCWSGVDKLQKEGNNSSNTSKPNYALLYTVMKTCKLVYLCLAALAFIIGVSVGTYYIKTITVTLTTNDSIIAWFIYLAAIVLNIYYGYYSVLLRGVGAVADVNKAMIFARITQIGLCIVLTVTGTGLIGIAMAYFAYGLLFRISAKRRFFRTDGVHAKETKTREQANKYSIKYVVAAIWPNTWKDGIVTLSNYLLNQATTIVASLSLSLYETGVYSLCVQLATASVTIGATLYNTYQPALQSAYVNKDKEAQKKYMSLIVFMYCVVSIIGFVCILLVGNLIISWVKPSYVFDLGVMSLVCLYQFTLKLRNCYATYFSTTNRLIYTKAFLVSAVVCLGLSVLLCITFSMGVYGLLFAQIISQIVYNAWYWMLKAHRELELGLGETISLAIRGIKELVGNGTAKMKP